MNDTNADDVPKTKDKSRERLAYGFGAEAHSVHNEIGSFDYTRSPAYMAILHFFGPTIKLRELKAIISALQLYLKNKSNIVLPPMSRNTKRSYPLLVKYIQDNFAILVPMFPNLTFLDENMQPVPLSGLRRCIGV